MFYKFINSGRLRYPRGLISCILIVAFITSLSSCVTTSETLMARPGEIDNASIENITKIFLKDGTVIDSENKIIQIQRESDTALFFLIWTPDKIVSGSDKGQNVINWSKKKIPSGDISRIEMENSKINYPLSLLIVAGGFLVLTLILLTTSGGPDMSNITIPVPR